MADDIAYRICRSLNVQTSMVPDHSLQVQLLHELASLFSSNDLSLESYDLSIPSDGYKETVGNRLIAEELCYDRLQLESQIGPMYESLNSE